MRNAKPPELHRQSPLLPPLVAHRARGRCLLPQESKPSPPRSSRYRALRPGHRFRHAGVQGFAQETTCATPLRAEVCLSPASLPIATPKRSYFRRLSQTQFRDREQFAQSGLRQPKAAFIRSLNSDLTTATASFGCNRGSPLHSSGRPRVCINTTPHASSAQVDAIASSQRKPLTSLTISAPAATVAFAVSAL